MFSSVDVHKKIAEREKEILKLWKEKKAFEKSLKLTKNKPRYTFYDGPPFATGTPHYGHIVASVMKDMVPRYWSMRGYYVERRWGWDCHGLPIENIVEKEMGSQKKKDIEKIGVAKFNQMCRSKVLSYVEDWKKVINRLGRWVDMENAYKTMDLEYMESVWWVFKQLYDKKLIYKNYRSLHICPRCETTLSQSEVTEGYKDIKDLSVIAKFKLKPNQKINKQEVKNNAYILAWTTTPWTLPGNVALAVGPKIKYSVIEVQENNQQEIYIIAQPKVKEILNETYQNYKILAEVKGKELVGLKYEPLWNTYTQDRNLKNRENGWRIVEADFVTTKEGTGVVHIAPAFGEDDMKLGKEKKLPFVQHVGMDGIVDKKVEAVGGLNVKPIDNPQSTDVEVIKYLASKKLLFHKEKYEHSYPHCWRCDSPLINYATSSWFVKVTALKKEAIQLAQKINWSPAHIKTGRFGKWLEGARDWSISRQRFWASVIPIWECDQCGKRKVFGSTREINQKLGKFLVLRHGEAENNIKKICSSLVTDKYSLTEKGRKQVIATAKKLEKEKIDLILASDLIRTKETAEIIAQKLGVKIIFDKRLREVNVGKFNGKTFNEIKDFKEKWNQGKNIQFPQGDSWESIKERVTNFYNDIFLKYRNKNKNILIISHADILITLEAILKGKNYKAQIKKIYQNNYIKNGELRKINYKLLDLHKHIVDGITFSCDKRGCQGQMKRVPDVLDTWFDSGSMPYAQKHYPFENKKIFDKTFPADFIAEGQDQTRAWFYYLHVLAIALKHKPAFYNVIVNGIVLAEDGKKMSKKLKNYPDPMEMFEKYGADAVRFYLMSSPVVAAQNLNFSEKEVAEIVRGTIRMLFNSYSFFITYAKIDHWKPQKKNNLKRKNLLDRWIISELNLLVREFNHKMEAYQLHKATRLLPDFIDNLSNWYIRRSRRRFWKSENDEDKQEAYETLYYVLLTLSKIIAPVMPFLAEEIYSNLANSFQKKWQSVHWQSFPQSQENLIDEKINQKMKKTREIIREALQLRSQAQIKVRQPLSVLYLDFSDNFNADLKEVIQEEVNIKKIIFLKKENKKVLKENQKNIIWNETKTIGLDKNITNDLKLEGQAREIIRFIQQLRKKANYNLDDRIQVTYQGKEEVWQRFGDLISKEVLAAQVSNSYSQVKNFDIKDKQEIENDWLEIKLKK